MTASPIVSVILPIYNTSAYLKKCVGSVLEQSMKELEVILVNDGSTDGSLRLCQELQSKDDRIVIIDKKNEGLEMARRTGLSKAKGKYILSVDSDDWLCDSDIIRKMYETAEREGVDYVEMGMQRAMGSLIQRKSIQLVTGKITQPKLFDEYYVSFFGQNILSVNVCGKLYRKQTLDDAGIQALGITMGEDLGLNMQLFVHLKSIYILPDIGYSYRYGGMTTKYNPLLYPDLKKLYLYKLRLIEQYNYHKADDLVRIEIKNVLRSDIMQMIEFGAYPKMEIIRRIQTEMEDPMWEDVLRVRQPESFHHEEFVIAIKRKDAVLAYNHCKAQVDAVKLKRKCMRLLSRLIAKL